MSDDLNLLITYISTDQTLVKVAVCIEHGMNLPIDGKWRYYKEDDGIAAILSYLPLHVVNHVDFIVHVEEIFYIGDTK